MKDMETKQRFIELRAKGFSFDKIANEISVSKPTLIKWSKEFQDKISNQEFMNYQNILEQNKVTKQQRIKLLAKELRKINETISQKSYEDLSLKNLHLLREKVEKTIKGELADVSCLTGNKISRFADILNDSNMVDEKVWLEV